MVAKINYIRRPRLTKRLDEAKNPYEILPRERARAEAELLGLQVTTRSPMGAIALECGGIAVDHGWLRILGSGCERMNRGIYGFNLGKSFSEIDPLVADNILGGF